MNTRGGGLHAAHFVLPIEGMSCDGCVRTVTQVLETAGYEVIDVTLKPGRAVIAGDDRQGATEVVEDAGYTVAPA